MAEQENGSSPLAEALTRSPGPLAPAPACAHLVGHEPRDAQVSYL